MSGKNNVLLVYPGHKGLLLPGGRGGRGNASFKSGTIRSPRLPRMAKRVLKCGWS